MDAAETIDVFEVDFRSDGGRVEAASLVGSQGADVALVDVRRRQVAGSNESFQVVDAIPATARLTKAADQRGDNAAAKEIP